MTGRPLVRATSRIQASSDSTARLGRTVAVEARRALDHARGRGPAARRRARPARRRRPRCPARSGRRAPGGEACASSRSRARRRRSASSTSAHIARELGRGRRLARLGREAAIAHRVVPHRAVTDHPPDVDALRQQVERVEVLAVGLPAPREPVEDAARGDVLDRLHHLGEVLAVLGAHGRERHAAVAHHDRRHAVPARRAEQRVPADLRVEVRVQVDEARASRAGRWRRSRGRRAPRPHRPRRCGRR